MKIEISKQEYRDLLDVLHMVHWLMHAHKTEKDSRTEPYDRIIQKFYVLAKAMGQDRMVSYDPDRKEYFPTREFEETTLSWELIDEFTEDTFWDELTSRVTERDMARHVGGYENLRSLSREEWSTLEAPIHEHYSEEFYRNGIERLEIVENFQHDTSKKPIKTHD